MRLAGLSVPAPLTGAHPAVLNRRLRELALVALAALLALAASLAISLADTKASFALPLGLMLGGGAIVWLVVNKRIEVSLTIVALYLGLVEGPLKLGTGSHATTSVVRDVLIFAVALGALLRLSATRQRVRLPPLSAWALLWLGLVAVEVFNPKTASVTKALGGIRQQAEWVPFFFFGYALMRSKARFRKVFLLLGVIALANGVVSTYQAKLSPGQLASWGPGYRELVFGGENGKGLKGRTYSVEGTAFVRPPGLGTDAGFGGGVGALAIPATLALLATGGLRRRWPVLLLTFGALAAVATGLGRLQLVAATLSVALFAVLSFSAGKRVTRPLAALLGVVVLAIPLGAVFVSALGGKTFSRYATISPSNLSSSTKDTKTAELANLPSQIASAPFGAGLGRVGAAAGFGGKVSEEGLEKHNVGAETQYTFVTDELGLPGLVLWCALTIRLLTLMLPGLRRIRDIEMRVYLSALTATLVAFTLVGLSGPTMGHSVFGPFFWTTVGAVAYWFVRRAPEQQLTETRPTLEAGVA